MIPGRQVPSTQVPSTKHFYHPQPVVWRLTLPWRNACAVVFSPATMRQAGFGGVCSRQVEADGSNSQSFT